MRLRVTGDCLASSQGRWREQARGKGKEPSRGGRLWPIAEARPVVKADSADSDVSDSEAAAEYNNDAAAAAPPAHSSDRRRGQPAHQRTSPLHRMVKVRSHRW